MDKHHNFRGIFMLVSFSVNHDGDVLVLVNGKVICLAKDCEGLIVSK